MFSHTLHPGSIALVLPAVIDQLGINSPAMSPSKQDEWTRGQRGLLR